MIFGGVPPTRLSMPSAQSQTILAEPCQQLEAIVLIALCASALTPMHSFASRQCYVQHDRNAHDQVVVGSSMSIAGTQCRLCGIGWPLQHKIKEVSNQNQLSTHYVVKSTRGR